MMATGQQEKVTRRVRNRANLENVLGDALGGGNHGSLRQRSSRAHDGHVVGHVVGSGTQVLISV